MIGHYDHTSQIETTFRMGLKGGIHWLASPTDPIYIDKMHFDGHKHYGRKLDKNRIVDRLKGLRDYCAVKEIQDIIDDRGSNPEQPDSQEYEDCQLLQLTDLLVSGFRSLYCGPMNIHHKKLIQPLNYLIKKYSEGNARMKNSRWYKSFCISQCYLEKEKWMFDTIEFIKKPEGSQLSLFTNT